MVSASAACQGPKPTSCSSTRSSGDASSNPGSPLTPGQVLTLLQLVPDYPQEGHGDHEQVDDEAGLTQLPDGGATQPSNHALVGGLATDGGGIAQDDQPTDQEDQGDLQNRTMGPGVPTTAPQDADTTPSGSHLQKPRLPTA